MAVARAGLLGSLRRLLGPDPEAARQSLAALAISLGASLVAGLALGGIADTLERLPGLLVLVPAAIGLRGTIFGALGSRLGTAIHAGTYRLSLKSDSVLGSNVVAAGVLSVFTSTVLAVLAWLLAVAFGFEPITVTEFIAISIVGGLLSSVPVLFLTVRLADRSVRRSWDLDNVMAPLVTATGDMVTLPALWVASFVVAWPVVTNVTAALAIAAAAAFPVLAFRRAPEAVRSILREAMPIVVIAGLLSLVAGLTLESQIERLVSFPALLALVPPFLASGGALGGIISARLTSKLHLGLVEPSPLPRGIARTDVTLAVVLALPVFAMASGVADVAALLVDMESPGVLLMLGIALLGGVLTAVAAAAIAYYGAIVTYRLGLDPDNFGIPIVTSGIDLVGSVAFIFAVVVLT